MTPPTRATLVYNPVAGGQRVSRGHLRTVVGYLTEHHWTVDWQETTPERGATEIARQAIDGGAEVVIAAGGDGTINEVVNALIGHPEVRLGILPTGTANVWAVESGISDVSLLGPNLETAGETLVNGRTVQMDVGRAGERHFLLVAGVGFDALVTRRIDPKVKRAIGALAYAWAAIREGVRYRGARIMVTVDGEARQEQGWMVTISNTRLYALVPLAREASVVDGLLDVGIFAGRRWPSMMRHAASILLGRQAQDPGIEFLRGREIVISSEPPLPVQVDAEPMGMTPMTFTVVPGAIRVILPRQVARKIGQSAFRIPEPTAAENGTAELKQDRDNGREGDGD